MGENISENNWSSEKISKHYDYLHKHISKRIYNIRFGSSFTSKKILQVLKDRNATLLDVGIGSGNLFRFLKINKAICQYAGADINPHFVRNASKLYPEANFILTDSELNKNLKDKYEFVYSRGVLPHQVDPLNLLKKMIDKAEKGCVVDLRTRDIGKTETDPDKSCQFVDGVWVPHIVINYDELMDFIKSFEKLKLAKILINKNYMVLGGYRGRFLPKDLYIPESKAANTTLCIDLQSKRHELITSYYDEKIIKDKKYYFKLILDFLQTKLFS